MFAVIKTGGKQYHVASDDVITIEKLSGEVGERVTFGEVLMLAGEGEPRIGSPLIAGASVAGEVVEQGRAKKVIVFKKRRRQNYRRKKGHRQLQTTVRITEIVLDGKVLAKASAAPIAAAATVAAGELSPIFTRPAGEPDDLTRISGVGPVIAEKLDKLGVIKFAQVAAFTPDDIARVDAVLNFKGRIERENWVEQAKKLAAEQA
ncbi:MAG: 50S ribosomal protein L21 [Rhizobiales bacterium]|nr:50S ribosomal protein L21 [Hyphomicrobiales bacterium]